MHIGLIIILANNSVHLPCRKAYPGQEMKKGVPRHYNQREAMCNILPLLRTEGFKMLVQGAKCFCVQQQNTSLPSFCSSIPQILKAALIFAYPSEILDGAWLELDQQPFLTVPFPLTLCSSPLPRPRCQQPCLGGLGRLLGR